MGWIYLTGAILFEITGTMLMRYSDGLRHFLPALGMFVCYAICFTLLTFSLKTIPMGIAYAVWAGLGTALVVVLSAFLFQEPLNPLKIASISLIILGIVGLNLGGAH